MSASTTENETEVEPTIDNDGVPGLTDMSKFEERCKLHHIYRDNDTISVCQERYERCCQNTMPWEAVPPANRCQACQAWWDSATEATDADIARGVPLGRHDWPTPDPGWLPDAA